MENISPNEIKQEKLANPNKIVLGHHNINFIRAKFECLRVSLGKTLTYYLSPKLN